MCTPTCGFFAPSSSLQTHTHKNHKQCGRSGRSFWCQAKWICEGQQSAGKTASHDTYSLWTWLTSTLPAVCCLALCVCVCGCVYLNVFFANVMVCVICFLSDKRYYLCPLLLLQETRPGCNVALRPSVLFICFDLTNPITGSFSWK